MKQYVFILCCVIFTLDAGRLIEDKETIYKIYHECWCGFIQLNTHFDDPGTDTIKFCRLTIKLADLLRDFHYMIDTFEKYIDHRNIVWLGNGLCCRLEWARECLLQEIK